MVRKHRNRIELLKISTGDWISDSLSLEQMVQEYYYNLFHEEDVGEPRSTIPNGFVTLSEDKQHILRKPFTEEEIKRALFDMAPFKAPGVGGIHAGFYQKLWEVVGASLCGFVMDFMVSGTLREGTNDTQVVLIPKNYYPEQISYLRPISLCNVSYKVITKTLSQKGLIYLVFFSPMI